jgi:hypothetical protein
MKTANMELDFSISPTELLDQLKRAFPDQAVPPIRSPFARPLHIGSFSGSSVVLSIVDTTSAGWLAPRFEGVVQGRAGGCRLVGSIGYNPYLVPVLCMGAMATAAVSLSMFLSVIASVVGAIAATLGLLVTIGLPIVGVQSGLRRRLASAIATCSAAS